LFAFPFRSQPNLKSITYFILELGSDEILQGQPGSTYCLEGKEKKAKRKKMHKS
jgi:hypothetical protein